VAGHLPICADKVAGPTSGEAHHGLQCAARSRCTAGPTVNGMAAPALRLQ
jgi:hypothetical protein